MPRVPVHVSVSRLVVEMCGQEDWTLGEMDIRRIAEAFAIGESHMFLVPVYDSFIPLLSLVQSLR